MHKELCHSTAKEGLSTIVGVAQDLHEMREAGFEAIGPIVADLVYGVRQLRDAGLPVPDLGAPPFRGQPEGKKARRKR